jgi:hypothetical protein
MVHVGSGQSVPRLAPSKYDDLSQGWGRLYRLSLESRKELRVGDRLKSALVTRIELLKVAEDGTEFDGSPWGCWGIKVWGEKVLLDHLCEWSFRLNYGIVMEESRERV